jgi:flagellar secretion chaperone FliS
MQNASYLEAKVLTAPPQQLQLMLIDGAIRFGRQAQDALQRGEQLAAAAPLLRMIDIVGELLAVVRENKSDLNRKIADLYSFLFRRVSEAKINSDGVALREVLELLEFERQTWQLLCDKLGSGNAKAPHAPLSRSFGASHNQTPKSGISFEA